ncbi:NAD(P)H-binding protein [Lichenicoccus sp.]|uniref:SDR family oxidoreductase n=1 Tax=Lichenicoccus sp. TaxID=2781899 RepID=UPI003D12C143
MSDGLPARVHVIGASGRSGAALSRALLAAGAGVVAVVRSRERWQRTGLAGDARLADLEEPAALAVALSDATHIVCTAHARNAERVIAAAPAFAQLVFLGSTRKFTRWPDAHCNGVLAGERALLRSRRCGIMLHPTMIYGADGENNIRRLASLLRRLPAVPLPGGGRALVQPINQSDLTRAILACLRREWIGPHSLVVAGPEPISYREFAAAIARAWGLRPRPVLAVPAALLIPLSMLTMALPGLPTIGPAEIRRLLEDKAFDIGPMRDLLGIEPISLEQGLAAMAPTARPQRRGRLAC